MTPAERWPWLYDRCICGNPKWGEALWCRACYFLARRDPAVALDQFWSRTIRAATAAEAAA